MKEDEKGKAEYLKDSVRHIQIKELNSIRIIDGMRHMSFTARDTANATDIFSEMLEDKDCTIILCIAGSTSAAGCMQIYIDMVRNKMVDVIVATGATIVDMDFFEALGFKHYQGSPNVDDDRLCELGIDRIYDTFIDEDELKECDEVIFQIANSLERRPYSSREFIREMGKYLKSSQHSANSLIESAYDMDVPIFCPAFSDSSAGFGLVKHQYKIKQQGLENYWENCVSIDSVKDFMELTEIKLKAKTTGLFMIGGGAPKNFAQDTVVCSEVLGYNVDMHKYAVQITVADARDGACSSSTLSEATSWGKVDSGRQQMVYAEATSVLPLIISYIYHKPPRPWAVRKEQRWNKVFEHAK